MARKSTYLTAMLAAIAAILLFSGVHLPAQDSTETPAAAAPTTPDTEEQPPEITEAIEKFNQRDFAAALKLLETAVKNDPDLPPARVIMAQMFVRRNQPAGVRNSLEGAIIEVPSDPQAYVILGDYALRERRVTEAGLLFEKANELLKKFTGSARRKKALEPQVLAGLASVAQARGNWTEVQKQVEAWLKIDPDSAAAMQRLARALFKLKKPKESLDMLKAAKKADENVLTPSARLATYYEQAGDRANAKKWMEYAVKTDAPKDLPTHLVATQWALETNQIERAKQLAKESTDLDPKNVDANFLRGVVNLFLGDHKAAEGYFRTAHTQAPDDFRVTNNLALAMAEQDDDSKKHTALAYAEGNVRKYPRSGEAHSTYGWILYKMGRPQDAAIALQRAMQMGNPTNDTIYYFSRVLADGGKRKEAKALLGAALKSERPFSKRAEAAKLYATLEP